MWCWKSVKCQSTFDAVCKIGALYEYSADNDEDISDDDNDDVDDDSAVAAIANTIELYSSELESSGRFFFCYYFVVFIS